MLSWNRRERERKTISRRHAIRRGSMPNTSSVNGRSLQTLQLINKPLNLSVRKRRLIRNVRTKNLKRRRDVTKKKQRSKSQSIKRKRPSLRMSLLMLIWRTIMMNMVKMSMSKMTKVMRADISTKC